MLDLALSIEAMACVGGSHDPLAAYPLALDFKNGAYWKAGAKAASLSAMSGYSYTRTGQVSFVNATNTVENFAANVPPIPTGVGYEAYGALTNLLLGSQTLNTWLNINDGAGTGTAAVVTADQAVAPDGTSTADLVSIPVRSASTRRQAIYQAFTGTAVPYTGSIFVKAQTAGDIGKQIALQIWDGTAGTEVAITLTASWQRVAVTRTLVASPGCNLLFGRDSSISDLTAVGFYVWQGQVVAGSFADGGPIIATAGATASIGAQTLSVSVPNASYSAVYTFSDLTTQTIPTTISGGVFTMPAYPATLNKPAVSLVTLT